MTDFPPLERSITSFWMTPANCRRIAAITPRSAASSEALRLSDDGVTLVPLLFDLMAPLGNCYLS